MGDEIFNSDYEDLLGFDNIVNKDTVDEKKLRQFSDEIKIGAGKTTEEEFDSECDKILNNIQAEKDSLEMESSRDYSAPPPMSPYGSSRFETMDNELQERTSEEVRKNRLDEVFTDMGISSNNEGTNSAINSIEKEQEEEEKNAMLSEIDELLIDLRQVDENLDRIPKVDSDNTYKEIKDTLQILQHKMNRQRYSSFAEELIITGVTFVEELFDGKQTYFGRFSPDLTGWNRDVRVKLRRSRHDTQKIVSGTIASLDLPPILRLALELIPSMILYSRNQKMKKNSPNKYNEQTLSDADNKLRDI